MNSESLPFAHRQHGQDARATGQPLRDLLVPPVLGLGLVTLFLLTWNPWWVPTGDSEVYLVTARNLARGDGLSFLGHHIAFVPPGWSMVLAGLLWLGASIAQLKLLQIAFMTGGLLLCYGILRHLPAVGTATPPSDRAATRRVADAPTREDVSASTKQPPPGGWRLGPEASDSTLSPTRAALCVGLAAICTPLYPLTFWLHTDALFLLVAALATWLALRWSSGRSGAWAMAAALTLVAVGVSIRWAGMVYAAVVAGALLSRFETARPTGVRLFAAAGVFLIAGASYVLLRLLLGGGGGDGGGTLALATVVEEARVPSLFVRERPDLPVIVEFLRRLTFLPSWITWTLWVPSRFVAYASPAGRAVDWIVGGLALVLIVLACIHQARRGRWVLTGAMVYVLGLCVAWPHVNNRYMVPVLPFVIAGVLSGLDVLRHATSARAATRRVAVATSREEVSASTKQPPPGGWRLGRMGRSLEGVSNALRTAFIAALVLVNGAMWGLDVWVARSPTALDFYARYEAGVHLSLIEVAAELNRRTEAAEGAVAVSERYENLRERWDYPTSQRVVAYIADITAEPVPRPLTGWGVRKLQQWARDHQIRYYVHQNPTVPGRIWHFRLSRAEHGQVMGDLPGPHQPQFELYEMFNHPTPQMPDRRWLELTVTPPLTAEQLDRLGRQVPGVSDES